MTKYAICTFNEKRIYYITAERCSRINAKLPLESAVKTRFYNLTNLLQRTLVNARDFPVLYSHRILTLVSNCRNLHNASPSFSKDGCTHAIKSVLRFAKRPNDFKLQTNSYEMHFSHAKHNRVTLVSNPKNSCCVSPYFQVWGNVTVALHRIRFSGAKGSVCQ